MICLDTCFVVDFLRGEEKAKILLQKMEKKNEIICVASPTIMELISAAYLSSNPSKESRILSDFLSSLNVLPLNFKSAELAGKIEAELVLTGQTTPSTDIMIAAIATTNNSVLLTRNKKHFEKIPNLELNIY